MFKKLIFERHSWPAKCDKIVVTPNNADMLIKRTLCKAEKTDSITVAVPAKEFLEKFDAIDVMAWDNDYFAPVLDGESWSLKYYTTDGNKKVVTGSNAYPEEYDALFDLLFIDD